VHQVGFCLRHFSHSYHKIYSIAISQFKVKIYKK